MGHSPAAVSGSLSHSNRTFDTDYSNLNRYEVTAEGEQVADNLYRQSGIRATLVSPRYITGIDHALLERLKASHRIVVTLEDGVLDGASTKRLPVSNHLRTSEPRTSSILMQDDTDTCIPPQPAELVTPDLLVRSVDNTEMSNAMIMLLLSASKPLIQFFITLKDGSVHTLSHNQSSTLEANHGLHLWSLKEARATLR